VIVCAPGLCRPSGCSPAAPRPAWRRRRTARILVVADAQPAAAGQPGDRAFHLPAVAAEPGRWFHGTAGDPHPDPLPREVAAAAAVVVGLVGVDLVGSIAPSTPGRTDLGDVVQQGLEDCRSGVLAAVISSDSGNPVPSAARWSLHPGLARSTSPRTARRLKESTVTRAQSSAPTAELVQQELLQSFEHPCPGPLGKPPPATRHTAAAELTDWEQRPWGGGAGHEQDRGHAGPVRDGSRCTAAGVGWRVATGLDALPQRVGRQPVGQSCRDRIIAHHRLTHSYRPTRAVP
jgi:hypothetical protein